MKPKILQKKRAKKGAFLATAATAAATTTASTAAAANSRGLSMGNFIFPFLAAFGLGGAAFLVVASFMAYNVHPVLNWGVLASLGLLFAHYVYKNSLFIYVGKRLLEAVVVLWVIASLTFVMLRVIPGGPFDSEKALPPEVKANIEAKYNLDGTLFEQYMDYLTGLLAGNLGESYKFIGRQVSDIVGETLPVSFQLGIFALILSYLIGLPAGVYAAARHNRWQDTATMGASISGVSLPSFLVAPLFILVFCFYFNWLPPALWEGPEYYLLPVLVLGIRPAAIIARLTRASVLEVIRADYIRTARAKGLSERAILYRHVLKNSLIPVLTFSGPLVAGVLSGSFIIELIFAVPGMGKHLVQSVTNRDYPLILGVTLVFSALLVLANLVVDLLYSYFDPRIKLS